MDDTVPLSLSPKTTDHCLLGDVPQIVNATFEKHSDPAIGINCCENGLKKTLKEQKVMEKHMKKLQALGKLHWCVENTDVFTMNP